MDMIASVWAAEGVYSLAHFTIAALILGTAFKVRGRSLFATSALISTVIPWSYSLGVLGLARILV